ncbi:MAG: hypothetical protein H0X46_02140 [Bacteroidetes bacterium]|nr:hypothetical protein [Bacteroidota bacterium]
MAYFFRVGSLFLIDETIIKTKPKAVKLGCTGIVASESTVFVKRQVIRIEVGIERSV